MVFLQTNLKLNFVITPGSCSGCEFTEVDAPLLLPPGTFSFPWIKITVCSHYTFYLNFFLISEGPDPQDGKKPIFCQHVKKIWEIAFKLQRQGGIIAPAGPCPALLGCCVVALSQKGHTVGLMDHEDAGLATQELEAEWKGHIKNLEVASEVSGNSVAPLPVTSVAGWKWQWPCKILGLQNTVYIIKLLLCLMYLLEMTCLRGSYYRWISPWPESVFPNSLISHFPSSMT